MATVTAFVRTSKKNIETANVRFRLRDGRSVQLFHSSEIEVSPRLWSNKEQGINPRMVCPNIERIRVSEAITQRKKLILALYEQQVDKDIATSQWLDLQIVKALDPNPHELYKADFFATFSDFIETHKVSEIRKKQLRVVYRALKRFELLKNISGTYALNLDSLKKEYILEFENFLWSEHKYFEKYPLIYEAIPECRRPIAKGQNTISGILSKFRTFCHWAIKNNKTTNNPFATYSIAEEIYGTPFYITIEERNKLYQLDLSSNRQMLIQRDIFVFQCLIGCRIGDLMSMTGSSVINNAIEYIPRKTKEGRPITVRVPLSATAKEIVSRYPALPNEKLLPFISEQKYNQYIKLIFKEAQLDRMVTVLNPTTRKEEKRPLCDIASSHLARRTFIGNLYKQVKDPNLVSSLSGHKEGSRAFSRYREIDEKIKKELVDLLE